jgi:hypothetical protein
MCLPRVGGGGAACINETAATEPCTPAGGCTTPGRVCVDASVCLPGNSNICMPPCVV